MLLTIGVNISLIFSRKQSAVASFCGISTNKLYLTLAEETNHFPVCKSFKTKSFNVVLV